MSTITWLKHPSVTKGGKPFFYRGVSNNTLIGSVVWNRDVRAYHAVAILPQGGANSLGYFSTPTQGKRAVAKVTR